MTPIVSTPDDIRTKTPETRYAWLVQAAIVLSLCLLAAACYGLTQELIAYGDGHPYDAKQYIRMAAEVARNETISAEAPFVYRVGLPWLVGQLFPHDLLQGFRFLNLGFAVLTLLVLYAFLLQFTRSTLVLVIALLLFVANPLGPFRLTHLYPGLTDAPALFLMLVMLLIHQVWPQPGVPKMLALVGLSLTGALVREITLVSPLAILVATCTTSQIWLRKNWPSCVRPILLSVVPVAIGALGILYARLAVVPDGEFPIGLLDNAKRNFHNPSLVLLSAFVSFGPIVALLVVQPRTVWDFLRYRIDLLTYLIVIGALSLFGGTTTDRLMYWTFPAVLPLLAVSIERALKIRRTTYALMLVISLAVAQTLAFRAFSTLPTAPFDPIAPFEDLSKQQNPSLLLFAPYGNASFAHMSTGFMNRRPRIILLGEYLALLAWICFLWWRMAPSSDRDLATELT
jgi:hypothetical protein